jgi:hypothetical protein
MCAVMFGIGIPALLSAATEAQNLQCIQNMRTQAQGVIAYDSAKGYLPPLATVNNHPGWNLQILPFIGQQGVYDILATNRLFDKDYTGVLTAGTPVNPYDIGDTNSAGSMSTFSGALRDWYRFTCATSGNIQDAFTKNDGDGISWQAVHTALAGVSEYRCPSRQPEAVIKKVTADRVYLNALNELKFNSDLYEQSCMRGATGDYAAGLWFTAVIDTVNQVRQPNPLQNDTVVNQAFFDIYAAGDEGAFRNTVGYAQLTESSNVWMFGEKYIPQFAITQDTPIANMWNGGLHRTRIALGGNAPALNASFRSAGVSETPIAVTGEEITSEIDFITGNGTIRYPANFGTGDYLWGSAHPGIVNMALGDGNVQSVDRDINSVIFNKKWRARMKAETLL